MLLIVSLLMVVGYSIYFLINSRAKDHKVNSSLAKCIPMMLGMTGGTTIGLVIASWIPDRLAVSTILAIVFSMGTAFLVGAGFGLSGLIEAQASSLMGAMMGAMLGVMLSADEMILMVMAMDAIYLVSIYAMILMLSKDSMARKQSVLKSKPASFYVTFLLSICLIGTVGILQKENIKVEVDTMHHNHEH